LKKKRVSSLTTRFVVFIGAVLFVTNIVLGTVLMRQSTSAFRTLIRNNMLALANTAAELLDGDSLRALTEEDVGSERCNDVLNKLKAFQSNIDIEYIYSVRQVGEDEFVFTVDADPENPAEFGEPVLVTDALRQAAKGIAAVDAEPAQDEWGNFYSAYSPVYDSTGQIAGIVGLDFNSEWYDSQIRENTKSIGILSVLFVVTGCSYRPTLSLNYRRSLSLNCSATCLSTVLSDAGSYPPASGNQSSFASDSISFSAMY
jgi:sensor histidine kinase regulating citrate/malate metabolism